MLDYESLSFQARFGVQPHRIYMPSSAVMAIYARENGAGTVFATEQEMSGQSEESASAPSDTAPTPPPKSKPTLKVIK
jgi:stringent starvation protein B